MPLYLVPLIVTLAIQIQVSLIVFTPPVLAPKAQFDIGVSAVAVGLITALIYLTSVPATLISSQILHRLGPIRVSQLCVLFTSFGMVLMVSASPFIVILGALIVGIGYGPITPASSAILANTVPKKFRGSILNGRDITYNIIPDATFKFYVTASISERSRRRTLELKRLGKNVSLKEVSKSLKKRDKSDKNRRYSPLKLNPDSLLINTTRLSITKSFLKVKKIIDRKLNNYARNYKARQK